MFQFNFVFKPMGHLYKSNSTILEFYYPAIHHEDNSASHNCYASFRANVPGLEYQTTTESNTPDRCLFPMGSMHAL